MKGFEKTHGRLPKARDKEIRGIVTAISRGEWRDFKIKTWNDLLKKTFGRVNHEKGKYSGKQGLDRVMNVLRDVEKTHGRLPVAQDKEVSGILLAIDRGEWEEFGIKTWNDLLKKTFGRVNRVFYGGRKGLEWAMDELKDFEKTHGRLPEWKRDEEIRKIGKLAFEGKWTSFGIKNWNDLLMKTFGKTN